MKTEKKEKAPGAKFWREVVKEFFDFCVEYFAGEQPTFDGAAPRDLKQIMLALEARAKKAGVEWTAEVAVSRLRAFLIEANKSPWLHENFLLQNLNRQKDKIFFNAKSKTNGTAHFGNYGEKPIPTVRPKGSFGKL